MEGHNWGWIEIAMFYGIALGFAGWQYWSVSKSLEEDRAKRRAEEEAAKQAGDETGES
ncbi:MAG: hypothetical protein AAGE86_06350 [Pseudomonadota bacterium]